MTMGSTFVAVAVFILVIVTAGKAQVGPALAVRPPNLRLKHGKTLSTRQGKWKRVDGAPRYASDVASTNDRLLIGEEFYTALFGDGLFTGTWQHGDTLAMLSGIMAVLLVWVGILANFTPLSKYFCFNTNDVKLVFVSNNTFAGDLGGLVGADKLCQEMAKNATIDGEFRAWLSNTDESPESRFERSSCPYVINDADRTVIANNFEDLLDGRLDNAIHFNLTGHYIFPIYNNPLRLTGEATVWTGKCAESSSWSTRSDQANCNNWTCSTTSCNGCVGEMQMNDQRWKGNREGKTCGIKRHLYCFQQ